MNSPRPIQWDHFGHGEPSRHGSKDLYQLTLEGSFKPWFRRYGSRRQLGTTAYERCKRVFDLVATIALLPVVFPLILICGILVKWDSPGPMFFFQERTGKGGSRFRLIKLRTMVTNAEEVKKRVAHLNELSYPDFKITNDPRITKFGHFLRCSSLDELPQFINVLKGEMSLVGPRPTSFTADTYRLWQTARLEAMPGITGLGQISGRSELDFDERLRLDIAYIQNRCLSLDIKILLRTFWVVLSGRGAR